MQTEVKNNILSDLAKLVSENSDAIIDVNKQDLAACSSNDEALYDRLKVNEDKIQAMIDSIMKVRNMDDPEGHVLYRFQKEDDLLIENRVVPFGNILIIYESRPDVTIEAAITAFKAGNRIFLKGGKEALKSNRFLAGLWQRALRMNKIDESYVQYLDYDRQQTQQMIADNSLNIDVIIPRGGESLIESIRQNTSIPMIISGRGNNFMYIDKDFDYQMAEDIILDGKSRISVCNALDKVYINQNIVGFKETVKKIVNALVENNIQVLADRAISARDSRTELIDSKDIYYEEFLASKILLATVNDMSQAIRNINKYSGGHSAVIISNNDTNAEIFQNEVDCAAVYHNASTRFTDGGQFGLGAEIAISTQKLHFRGPVGLNELVTNKWFVKGNGNTRG